MTTTELQAGRELDALVAEKILGINVIWRGPNDPWTDEPSPWGQSPRQSSPTRRRRRVPPYSADMRYAWEVVEALNRQNASVNIDVRVDGCAFVEVWRVAPKPYALTCVAQGEAPAAALAICRAALEALTTPRSRLPMCACGHDAKAHLDFVQTADCLRCDCKRFTLSRGEDIEGREKKIHDAGNAMIGGRMRPYFPKGDDE